MNFLIYLKNLMIVIVIVHVIAIVNKIIENVCLTDKYIEFCKEDSIIVKKITKSYLNVEYIKYLSLLQKIKLYLKN